MNFIVNFIMNFIMNSVQFFSLVALQGLEYFRQHEFDEWSGVGCLGTCCYCVIVGLLI